MLKKPVVRSGLLSLCATVGMVTTLSGTAHTTERRPLEIRVMDGGTRLTSIRIRSDNPYVAGFSSPHHQPALRVRRRPVTGAQRRARHHERPHHADHGDLHGPPPRQQPAEPDALARDDPQRHPAAPPGERARRPPWPRPAGHDPDLLRGRAVLPRLGTRNQARSTTVLGHIVRPLTEPARRPRLRRTPPLRLEALNARPRTRNTHAPTRTAPPRCVRSRPVRLPAQRGTRPRPPRPDRPTARPPTMRSRTNPAPVPCLTSGRTGHGPTRS